MKFIAAVAADLERSPMGTHSRLADNLAGKPILRRTLERVARMRRLSGIHVFCPSAQEADVRKLAEGLIVSVHPSLFPAPFAALVRAGRWWGLDGWRGGIGSLCVFDEDINLELLHEAAKQTGADAVISIPAAAPLLDPVMFDAMLEHYEANVDFARITIVQAPPGLAAVVLGRTVLDEFTPARQAPGVLLMYHPDRPIADLTGKESCYRPAADVVEARGRLLCDTRRSFERVESILDAGGATWDAARIGRWLIERQTRHVEEVPEEIEIELTTEGPPSLLHPRGKEAGGRGPISLETIKAIAEWIGEYDDVRIVLGGFGEPLAHPQFRQICDILRPKAAAIALRTSGIMPADVDVPRALFDVPLDVVEVMIDATTPETYRRVNGLDAFKEVSGLAERLVNERLEQRRVMPLIVPSFVKSRENAAEMEAFFDHWQRRTGMAVITGYAHRAGQRTMSAVTSMAPPARTPCLRVFNRAIALADGRMTTCDQDFKGVQSVGDVIRTPLRQLWRSEILHQIRESSQPETPLCAFCDEWHRP